MTTPVEITLPAGYDAASISHGASATRYKMVGDTLCCWGCTQTELDDALTAYDHTEYTKRKLRQALMQRRYKEEISGITFQGHPLATDRQLQAKVTSAYTLAMDDLWSGAWKFDDNVVLTLSKAEVIGLAMSVLAHVQGCFTVEHVKLAEITSTGTTDLDTGWPPFPSPTPTVTPTITPTVTPTPSGA